MINAADQIDIWRKWSDSKYSKESTYKTIVETFEDNDRILAVYAMHKYFTENHEDGMESQLDLIYIFSDLLKSTYECVLRIEYNLLPEKGVLENVEKISTKRLQAIMEAYNKGFMHINKLYDKDSDTFAEQKSYYK